MHCHPPPGSSAHRLEDQLGNRVILDGQSAASVASQEDKKTDDEKPVDHSCEARISGDSSLSVRGLPGLDPAAEPSALYILAAAPPIRRDRIRKSCSKFLDFAPHSSFKSAAAPAILRNAPTVAFQLGTLRLRGIWIDLALLINARWDHFGSSTRCNHRVRKL